MNIYRDSPALPQSEVQNNFDTLLVENYMSNMFLLPESGLGIIFLINMNDYLVTNQLDIYRDSPALPQSEVQNNFDTLLSIRFLCFV